MSLTLKLQDQLVTLELRKKARVVDFVNLRYYHDLDRVLTPLEVSAIRKRGYIIRDGVRIYKELLTGLISGLDKLLNRNKMSPKVLKNYKTQDNLGPDSTSHKIASAFVQGLKVNF